MKRGNNRIFETLLIYSDTLYVLLSFVLSTCLKRTGLCVCVFPFPALGVIKGHECIIFQGLYWLIFELFFYVVCIIDSHHLSHLEQRRILGSSVHLPSESEIILYENTLNSLCFLALFFPTSVFSLFTLTQKQLAALGLVDAWNETSADFSTASSLGRGKLHLGAVLHWMSVELAPESGSKDGMHEDEDVEKPKIFYADHSFIILVRDNSTGALLMIGALDQTDGPAIHDEL